MVSEISVQTARQKLPVAPHAVLLAVDQPRRISWASQITTGSFSGQLPCISWASQIRLVLSQTDHLIVIGAHIPGAQLQKDSKPAFRSNKNQ